MSRILVVGDVMMDVVVRPHEAVAPTSDTPSSVRVARGGSAANVAVALARRVPDAEVVFVGCAGSDATAEWARSSLEESGVIARFQRVEGVTGVVVSLVAPDGQRAMMTDRGANPRLRVSDVVSEFGDLRHLHVSGYQILDPATRGDVPNLLAQARRARATTSLDVCSLAPLLAAGVQIFSPSLAHTDYLFANEEEALALSGASSIDRALDVLASRVRVVVITRGSRGALARDGEHVALASSVASTVVDTTGAGDAATGVFLGSHLTGHSVQMALDEAMQYAAGVVTRLGAT